MKNHDLNFLELVESSLLKIGECDIHEVKTMQEESKDFYLIDVREDREWVEGHIRGSIHLGKGIIERDIGRTIEDKSKLDIKELGLSIYTLDKDNLLIGNAEINLFQINKFQPYTTGISIVMEKTELCSQIKNVNVYNNKCSIKKKEN